MSNAEQIRKLEKQIAELKEADERFAALNPAHRLAITLHSTLCHHNHTDGCGWEYEMLPRTQGTVGPNNNHNWNSHTHNHYLQKAYMVRSFCDNHNIDLTKIIDLAKLLKE